jgi:WD40 repeat protein
MMKGRLKHRRQANLLQYVLHLALLWIVLYTASDAQAGQAAQPMRAPDLVVQSGHRSQLTCTDLSYDAKYLVTGAYDNLAILWDASTGLQIRRFVGHDAPINTVVFSPDGKWALTASGAEFLSRDNTARLWDVETGREIRRFVGHSEAVYSAVFSTDGTQILTAGGDGTARLWNTLTGKEIRRFTGHKGIVYAASFAPDGQTILTCGSDKTARMWNLQTGMEVQRFTGHTDPVRHAFFGRRKMIVVTISDGSSAMLEEMRRLKPEQFKGDLYKDRSPIDTTVRLWDAVTGKQAAILDGNYLMSPVAMLYDEDRLILTMGKEKREDGTTVTASRIWDTQTGKLLQRQELADALYQAAFFSRDERYLITEDVGAVRMSDARGRLLHEFTGAGGDAFSACFSADGRSVFVGGGDGGVQAWDVRTGRTTRVLRRAPSRRPWRVEKLQLSRDGRYLAGTMSFGQAVLWDLDTGEEIFSLEYGDRLAGALNYFALQGAVVPSSDGRHLLLANEQPAATLWDLTGKEETRRYDGHPSQVGAAVADLAVTGDADLSADGRYVVTVSGLGWAKVWEAASGKQIGQIDDREHNGGIKTARFSADGSQILTGSLYGLTQVWDWRQGKELRTFTGARSDIRSACFSRDERTVLTANSAGVAVLWDIATGKALQRFVGHEDALNSADISPDGRQVVTAGVDDTVRLWDVATGKELCRRISRLSPRQNDYVTITPQGYYSFTQGAGRSIAFRVGNRAYPFEQFDLKYNRPDRVLETLHNRDAALIAADRRAYDRRLARMQVTEADLGDVSALPRVTIVRLKQDPSTAQKSCSFQFRASTEAPDSYLMRLSVSVNHVPTAFRLNGIPVANTHGYRLAHVKTRLLEGIITIELSTAYGGRNLVELTAMNNRGIESWRESFEIVYTPAAEAPKPDLYFVSVGVSRYKNANYNLRYADQDADALAAFFRQHASSYGHLHILSLTNEQATGHNIRAARAMLAQSRIDDIVIVFVAGHGLLDRKLDYYYGVYDMDFSDPARKGLAYDEIERLVDGIAARRKLLLMDTCHAGEVDKETTRLIPIPAGVKRLPGKREAATGLAFAPGVGLKNSFALMQDLFVDLRRGTGTQVIASASGTQFAFERTGHGVFTQALLEALTQRITKVSALSAYVQARVQELTNGQQTPVARHEDPVSDFDVY